MILSKERSIINNNKININVKFFCSILIIAIALFSIYNKMLSISAIVLGMGVLAIYLLKKIYRGDFEKILVILFAMSIPILTDLNIVYYEDYHYVSKQYYRFNLLHIFAIIFLIIILKNIRKIKFKLDLLIILLFNFICAISIFYSINKQAAIYDYLRYVVFTIIYIYFTKVFNYEKYYKIISNCFIYGVIIQLIWGILQKIKGGALGLYFLGEGRYVFRTNVSGYEMGMSGSFGHPGPFAIYNLFVLTWVMFNKSISKRKRYIGIIVCSLNIVLAAGRTSIALMAIVYAFYYIINYLKINIKNFFTGIYILLICAILFYVFKDKFQPIIDRFLKSDMEMQLNSRFKHVELAMYYIKQNPLWGFGLNNYLDLTYRDFPAKFYSDFFLCNPIHNAYLLYAVEIGIIGAGIFILFILKNFVYLAKCLNSKEKNKVYIMKGYGVALIIYIIYNFQGWAGIQNRTMIMLMLTSAFMYKNYEEIKKR